MNHLAHCFLSFGQEEVMVGNFMGDWVKGRQWETYPPLLQQGLLLHRHIDAFTDGHPAVRACAGLVRPYAGRYAGPLVDILFDHVLATDWAHYTTERLPVFAQRAYATLHRHAQWLPELLRVRLPTMIEGDFLAAYARREGLAFAVERFSVRLPKRVDVADLLDFFHAEQALFAETLHQFFPELMASARAFLAQTT